MPIYTRTGDKGKTSLFDGTRVSKAHERVETYAAIDELNSVLGQALAFLPREKMDDIQKELIAIQHDLFAIGSALAMPYPLPVPALKKRVKNFEKMIDTLTEVLPELKNFILPGGSQAASLLHVGRTLARRAERRLVALMDHDEIDKELLMYLNRLSDVLFTFARYANFVEKHKEIKWVKK